MLFSKIKMYEIDMEQANSSLQNIFAACNQAPNTIPFDKIVLRQKANTRLYTQLLSITGTILLLTFLAPLYIVPLSHTMEKVFAPTPVILLNDYRDGDILYLQLAGDNILYEEAYMETSDGQKEYAVTYDIQKQLIGFRYDGKNESNIYIPIKGQEPLQFLLTPQ